MIRNTATGALLAVITAMFDINGAVADSYPSKPITIIVPFAAGGATEVLPRLFAERMQTEIGAPVVIENVS